jgi:hypothetical protein
VVDLVTVFSVIKIGLRHNKISDFFPNSACFESFSNVTHVDGSRATLG